MSSRKNKPPLAMEMDFNEALHRFARVDLKEVKESMKRDSDEKGANQSPKDDSLN